LSIEGPDDPVMLRSKLFLEDFLIVNVWDEQETDFLDGRTSLIEVSWVSPVSLDETENWTFFAVGDSETDSPEGSDFVLSGWVVVSDPELDELPEPVDWALCAPNCAQAHFPASQIEPDWHCPPGGSHCSGD